jgi:hypothetical protein
VDEAHLAVQVAQVSVQALVLQGHGNQAQRGRHGGQSAAEEEKNRQQLKRHFKLGSNLLVE